MSNFFTALAFLNDRAPVGMMLPTSVRTRGYNTSIIHGDLGTAADYPLDNVPWDTGVNGFVMRASATADDLSQAQTTINQAQAAFDTAQDAYESAAAAVASAQAVAGAAATAVQSAQDACDSLIIARFQAALGITTATRRGDADLLAAAQLHLTAVQAQSAAAFQSLSMAQTDRATATAQLGTATNARNDAGGALMTAQADLEGAEFGYTLLAAQQGDGTSAPTSTYTRDGSSLASNDFSGDLPTRDYDAYQCILASYYIVNYSNGQYQVTARLDAATYAAALAGGLVVKLDWNEVTTTTPVVAATHPGPPSTDPVNHPCPPYTEYGLAGPSIVSAQVCTETIGLDGAVLLATGDYQILSSLYTCSHPDPGTPEHPNDATSLVVKGMATMPSTSAVIEVQGAERWRQGFSENTTPGSQAQAHRYLVQTATPAPGTPAGTVYQGALTLTSTIPSFPYPAGVRAVRFGDYNPPARPLVLVDSLSDAAETMEQEPRSLKAVDEGVTTLTTTERVFSAPPGLRLTLSGEQSPGEIQTAVSLVSGADWPTVNEQGYTPPPPSIAFSGAIHFVAATGDYCAGQKMRFKLTHSANDSRSSHDQTFATTHRWEIHTRDLLTGAVSVSAQSATITWPVVRVDGDTASYVYTLTDADWTEIAVPAGNVSVKIVVLPGENPDPRTFVALPSAKLILPGTVG